jgi:hypothetical protein
MIVVVLALTGAVGEKPKEGKVKKPSLELKHRPVFPRSPAEMTFTAELKGGDDSEESYCPAVEWEWGDDQRMGGGEGTKSVEESDCDPWEPGMTIERRFEKEHRFSVWGNYRVRVTLRKGTRVIARQSKTVNVKAGPGDRTGIYEP